MVELENHSNRSNITGTENSTSIYIHWPFCESLCPYCDFNSYVQKNINQQEWSAAYRKAIKLASTYSDSKIVSSIYFGGGTPSLMNPNLVFDVINQVATHFHLNSNAEITLEANPGSADYKNFKSYSSYGVNRCSVGIQALNNKDLKTLGRLHTVEDAIKAFDIAQSCFGASSFDLIYGRPKQGISNWEEELLKAINLSPQHLSLYQLTIEPNTTFYKLKENKKLVGLPNDEKSSLFFRKTKEICESFNLQNYEISNFSVPGMESVHNLNYWRYGSFIGVGPGAYGRVVIDKKKFETETFRNPNKWLRSVLNKQNKIYSRKKKISNRNQAREYAIMSLRLKEGLNIAKFNSFSDLKLKQTRIKNLIDLDLITVSHGNLVKTDKGEILLNTLIGKLID